MATRIAEGGKIGGGAIGGALLVLIPGGLDWIERRDALEVARQDAVNVRADARADRELAAERYRIDIEASTKVGEATSASQQAAYQALIAICANR